MKLKHLLFLICTILFVQSELIAQTTVTIPTGWSKQSFTFTLSPNSINGGGIQFLLGALCVGQYMMVTGVQLEAGSVATPFEYRPMQMELALCQRYYYKYQSFSNLFNCSSIEPKEFLPFDKSISSVSQENISLMILEFEGDTSMDSALIEMRENLDMVLGQLPDNVGNPLQRRDTAHLAI